MINYFQKIPNSKQYELPHGTKSIKIIYINSNDSYEYYHLNYFNINLPDVKVRKKFKININNDFSNFFNNYDKNNIKKY